MKLEFANAWVLYLLWLVPAVGAWWYLLRRRQERALAAFLSPVMQQKLMPGASGVRFAWQASLVGLGLLLLLVAAARPRWGVRDEIVFQRGRDVVIALDVSRSMLAEDVRPNRLGRAKADILDLIKELRGDRAALLVFRRTGLLLCPLTTDYAFLRQQLDTVAVGSAPAGETSLGDAIERALDALGNDPGSHKVIVLISDGEDLAGKALKAAEKAAEKGIPIFTVGIGATTGARVPEEEGKPGYVKRDGADVLSKLDHEMLNSIAVKTGGAYIPIATAGITSTTLGTIYRDHVQRVTAREYDESLERRSVERYQYFLFAGFVLLLASMALSRGRLTLRSTRSESAPSIPGVPPPIPRNAVAILVVLGCLGLTAEAATNPALTIAVPPESSSVVTNAPVSGASIQGLDAARLGQNLYYSRLYKGAAEAYLNAAATVGPKYARDCRFNAAVALYKDGQFSEAADILGSLAAEEQGKRPETDMALGAASYRSAFESVTNRSAEALQQKAEALKNAAEAFRTAARGADLGDPAHRNLGLTLAQLSGAQDEAQKAELEAKYGKTEAAELAFQILKEQQEVAAASAAAFTNEVPERIKALEALAKRQKENSQRMIPLRDKLVMAVAQSQATNAQSQAAMIYELSDATRDSMRGAAEKLRDLDTEGRLRAQAANAAVYRMWKVVAPYQQVLQEDLYRQSNAIVDASAAQAGMTQRLERAASGQAEAGTLTEMFKERFSEAVPESGIPAQPPGPDLAPDAKASWSTNAALSAENRRKILDLSDQAIAAQREAAGCLERKQASAAILPGSRAYDILREIEKLLPRNNQQQQQQQQDQQQNEQKKDEQTQEQQNEDKKPEPKEQKPQAAEEAKPEEPKTPQDVKKILEKALEREREHQEELRRRNYRPPSPIDRDW